MDTIKAIIFDVDGTLYQPDEGYSNTLKSYWIDQISQYKRIPRERAAVIYDEYREKYGSSTKVLTILGLGTPFEIAKRTDSFQRKYLKNFIRRDRKLVALIKKLRAEYTVATLRNGTKVGTRYILSLLGFTNSRPGGQGFGPFDVLLPTVEIGSVKPDKKIFEHALRVLQCTPEQIVIVGDRVHVDLAPAHELGMKTVLVSWGKKPKDKTGVDAVVESIYDIEQLSNEG